MKKLALSFGMLLAALPSAQATSMSISGGVSGPTVYASNGTTILPSGLAGVGAVIKVGTLTVEGDFSSFIEFGSSTVKQAGVGNNRRSGKINGGVEPVAEPHNQFDGKPIYIWIYNTTDLPDDVAARRNIEQGLFKSTVNFPNDDPVGVGDDVTPGADTFLGPNSSIALPFLAIQATTSTTADTNGTGSFVLGAIPEPSTGLLAAGALLLAARRRRK